MVKIINLCAIKRITTEAPSFFDDTLHSVEDLLKKAGFQVVVSFNNIYPEAVNVIFGAGSYGTLPISEIRRVTTPSNTIIFNMEQIGSVSSLINQEYIDLLSDYVTLDYSCHNITALKEINSRKSIAYEFPLIPTMRFLSDYSANSNRVLIQSHLAFYGAMAQRRIERITGLESEGLIVNKIGGYFGVNLAPIILGSYAVLNLHAYKTGIFEVARCLRPMAMGIPIISEQSLMPALVPWEQSGILLLGEEAPHADYLSLLRNHAALQASARQVQRFIADPQWVALGRQVMVDAIGALPPRAS